MKAMRRLKVLVGSLAYPATDGEKNVANAGLFLTIVGLAISAVWASMHPEYKIILDWRRLMVDFVVASAVVMWLLCGVIYKGMVSFCGFHSSFMGWAGVCFLVVALAVQMANPLPESYQYRYVPDEEVYLSVVALCFAIGGGVVDVGLLIGKAIREYYQGTKT